MILPTTETLKRGESRLSSVALVAMVLISVGLLIQVAVMWNRHNVGGQVYHQSVLREALVVCQHNGGSASVTLSQESSGTTGRSGPVVLVHGLCKDGTEIRKRVENVAEQ